TRAQMPQVAANQLLKENNTFGDDLTLQWTEVPAEEIGRVVRSMKLQAIEDLSGNSVMLNFKPPSVQGYIAYTVSGGQILQGQAPSFNPYLGATAPATNFGARGAPLINSSLAATNLSLFWFN